MIFFPNAKINLGLRVIRKRDDGYHDLETIFYPVTLTDILEVVPLPDAVGSYSLLTTGDMIEGDPEQNLCVKAWKEISRSRTLPGASIHIHKIIPSGAGLGGGSSDGAFVLRALNELFGLMLSPDEMEAMALNVGSDCPFFLRNKPVMARGRGEIFDPVSVDLSGTRILVVHPKIMINTGWAYSSIVPAGPEGELLEIIEGGPGGWQKYLKNDFEPAVFKKYPLIREIKDRIISAGAFYASMTGSGSAVYGLFRKKDEIRSLKEEFAGMFKWEGVLD